jgi:hypothetical protein
MDCGTLMQNPVTAPGAGGKQSIGAGVQLAGVTEKLNGVTDGGRRKLNGVTDGSPEKGRRGHTFTHTERASVATI